MKPIIPIIAILVILVSFGLSHSLKGIAEIINLCIMGCALLYLMIILLKRAKK
jgi:hypothetical protein